MASFRYNKAADDWQIITGAEGTQNIAELLAAGGGGGTAEDVFEWVFNGNVSGGVLQDGFRIARRAGTIVGVIVSAAERGNNGTSLFDINKHIPAGAITIQQNATSGVTIFTTQGNRPDILGNTPTNSDNAVKQSPLPDVTAFAAGDMFSADVDNAVAQLQSVVLQVFVTYS